MRLTMLEFVLLTIGAFFETVCDAVVPRYARARMRYKGDPIDVNGLSGFGCWTLAVSVELFWMMEEFDVDPIPGLLGLARSNGIDLDGAEGPD